MQEFRSSSISLCHASPLMGPHAHNANIQTDRHTHDPADLCYVLWCVHSLYTVYTCSAPVHVHVFFFFLSPVQLTEPLLPLHSDSLFPTSASLSSSLYICQLSFHPPPMKSIIVMQFHKLDSWEMNWNSKRKHQRHGRNDFKLLFFWLIVTVCPHTRNFVSAEKTLGVGCEHPHLSNSHAKFVKTLCFGKKKRQSSSWQRHNTTLHRVNNTNKLTQLCTPISVVSLFSDTSAQAAKVEFILSDP